MTFKFEIKDAAVTILGSDHKLTGDLIIPDKIDGILATSSAESDWVEMEYDHWLDEIERIQELNQTNQAND